MPWLAAAVPITARNGVLGPGVKKLSSRDRLRLLRGLIRWDVFSANMVCGGRKGFCPQLQLALELCLWSSA